MKYILFYYIFLPKIDLFLDSQSLANFILQLSTIKDQLIFLKHQCCINFVLPNDKILFDAVFGISIMKCLPKYDHILSSNIHEILKSCISIFLRDPLVFQYETRRSTTQFLFRNPRKILMSTEPGINGFRSNATALYLDFHPTITISNNNNSFNYTGQKFPDLYIKKFNNRYFYDIKFYISKNQPQSIGKIFLVDSLNQDSILASLSGKIFNLKKTYQQSKNMDPLLNKELLNMITVLELQKDWISTHTLTPIKITSIILPFINKGFLPPLYLPSTLIESDKSILSPFYADKSKHFDSLLFVENVGLYSTFNRYNFSKNNFSLLNINKRNFHHLSNESEIFLKMNPTFVKIMEQFTNFIVSQG